MRTARMVSVAGSVLILASCSSSQNGSGEYGSGAKGSGNTGNGAAAATGNGASAATGNGASTGNGATGANGANGNGGSGATGTSGTGSTGTACLVGNACSTAGSYCVNGNIICTCTSGAWGLCTDSSSAGGSGNGAGGATSTACAYGNSCSTPGSTCASGTYSCTCSDSLRWQSCTTLTGGTSSTGSGGTTSTGTTGGTGTGAGGLPPGACAETYGEAQLKPPVIEITVDNTESMSSTAPSTGGLTKMAATRQALAAAFPRIPSTYAVGMTYYHVNSGPCNDGVQAVPIAPMAAAQVTALTNSINTQRQIQMTPSEDAWRFAANYLMSFTGLPANYAQSSRHVVVLTDGVPTLGQDCADSAGCDLGVNEAQYQTYIDAVAAAHAAGMQTYVIGVPGSENTDQVTCNGVVQYDPRTKLSQVAIAGGTAKAGCSDVGPNYCHIDLTNPNIDFVAELTAAIGMITATVASCQYEVPPPPPNLQVNLNAIEVRYYAAGSTDFTLIPKSADACATPVGWQFTDATNSGIVFCGDTCSQVQADNQARIQIYFGCLGEV